MSLPPWYKIATLRKEVREGRSFSPDEFAIALEQVVAGTAPEDYCDPEQFFARTCFTRALNDHAGMVLRRLARQTGNTAPVLTLVTQFGGGKTHTLAALYHLARAGAGATAYPGVAELVANSGVSEVPRARVGVFAGSAWDPREGSETPWIDLARQLAGDSGVEALGSAARTTPPGTEALGRVFTAAQGPVLLLFDEVLNFVNRHRGMADPFHAFIQNLTVAVTGNVGVAAVISLPRSQVEMTDWDLRQQERITKVVRRVARDLIANDESEIAEVVRRRLFEDLGSERVRGRIASTYANWCLERAARLPRERMAVDTARTERKAKELLRDQFAACYPFHPATLSVFQRKWRALSQFQQTRGALAMLAQWVSWAAKDHFSKARTEPLITLGSAPLHDPGFRAVVLGQLGETRLDAAIEADLTGPTAHAAALDADAKGPLRDLHRRVGAAILFESSGGQVEKVAHLPELRFALGEPDVDTTTIDNAAGDLDARGFFVRRAGVDGFRIHHQATLKKVVSDRRASLDKHAEVRPALAKLVKAEFERGATLPIACFPEEGADVPDSPRLSLVVLDPWTEWADAGPAREDHGPAREQVAEWTRTRGASPRLYPGALVWCAKKPGRELRDKTEQWLAWMRVARELQDGLLGAEFDAADHREVRSKTKEAEDAAKEEVWASYRYVALSDARTEGGLKVIDLGAGHASAGSSLCGRVVAVLKSEALLNESVGAGYIDRHWPPALKDAGAWPLTSLRQSFLNGSLTRLADPDAVLRKKIVEFVAKGDFGLASGEPAPGAKGGEYERLWFREHVGPDEVAFEASVYLLKRAKAEQLRAASAQPEREQRLGETELELTPEPGTGPEPGDGTGTGDGTGEQPTPDRGTSTTDQSDQSDQFPVTLRIRGAVPSESWNRVGLMLVPKLRAVDSALKVSVDFSVRVSANAASRLEAEVRQVLDDLDLDNTVTVRRETD